MSSTLSLEQVLRQEILEYLEGSEAILIKTITDMTSYVSTGMDKVTVPSTYDLPVDDVVSGVDPAATTRKTKGTTLLLNIAKRVYDYISFIEGKQSALDLKAAFLSNAPKRFTKVIEKVISTMLLTPNAHDFNSGVAGDFSIANFAHAKKLMDKAGIPLSQRFCYVNASGMEKLASTQEFQDGQKSLSAEALRMGVVSQVKGFSVIQSDCDEAMETGELKVVFYHKSAVAIAFQSEVKYEEEYSAKKTEEYVAITALLGCKDMDNDNASGVRKIVMKCKA